MNLVSGRPCGIALSISGALIATSPALTRAASTPVPTATLCTTGLLNPGFETPPPANWVSIAGPGGTTLYPNNGSNVFAGSASVGYNDTGGTGTDVWYQHVTSAAFTSGGAYDFTVFAQTQGVIPVSGNGAQLHLIFYNNGGRVVSNAYSATLTATTPWTQLAIRGLVIPPSAASFDFSLELDRSTGHAYFDNACFSVSIPASVTSTPSATLTPTATSSRSATASMTTTATVSPAGTTTATPSTSSTGTATGTSTRSTSATSTATISPTATITPTVPTGSTSTFTFTRSATDTMTSTATVSGTVTGTATATETPSHTLTPTATVTVPSSNTPSNTDTPSPSSTPTFSETTTLTWTPSPAPNFGGPLNQKVNSPSGNVAPGAMLNYFVTFDNTGGTAYGVSVTDVLDPRLDWTLLAANPPPAATPDATGLAIWQFGFVPAGGQSTISLTLPVKLTACHGSTVSNTARILIGGTPVASLGPVSNTVVIGTQLIFTHQDADTAPVCGASAGQISKPLLVLTVANPAISGARTVSWNGVRVSVGDKSENLLAPTAAFARFSLLDSSGNVLGAISSLPSSTTPVYVPFTNPIPVPTGSAAIVTLAADIASSPSVSEARVGIASSVDVDQVDQLSNCLVSLSAGAPDTFPMWGRRIVFSGATWSGSPRAFPNPFDPARSLATIQYYLEQPSSVTVTIYTQRGDRVRTLATGESRPAGLSCSEVWDGKNGDGQLVRTGVYLVVVQATPSSGGASQRQTLQLAVTR